MGSHPTPIRGQTFEPLLFYCSLYKVGTGKLPPCIKTVTVNIDVARGIIFSLSDRTKCNFTATANKLHRNFVLWALHLYRVHPVANSIKFAKCVT